MSYRDERMREFVVRTSDPNSTHRRHRGGIRHEVIRARFAREALEKADRRGGREADWIVGTLEEEQVQRMIAEGEIELSENGGGG